MIYIICQKRDKSNKYLLDFYGFTYLTITFGAHKFEIQINLNINHLIVPK